MKTKATVIFKKFIVTPLRKSLKWYFKQMAESGNYTCLGGSLPAAYYEWMWNREDERRKEKDNKQG